MKLIYCTLCKDIVRICNSRPKFCRCKESSGQYIDNSKAWYAGLNCIPLGIDNNSFHIAVRDRKKNFGNNFTAFVIPLVSDTFKSKREWAL